MSKPAQINLATLYSGRSRHAIDTSNRIMLKADWRIKGAPDQFFVMAHPSEHCLVAYPPAAFEVLLTELRDRTADKVELADIERGLNDRSRRVNLDPQGRLPLPTELMAKVGLEKQGELVGRFSKLEIWPCNKYEASQSALEKAATTALSSLESL